MPDTGIAVVGIGGIGSAIAAALLARFEGKIDLSLVARGRRQLKLLRDGLLVRTGSSLWGSREFTVLSSVPNRASWSFIFVCTKFVSNTSLAQAVARAVSNQCTLIVCQNRWEPDPAFTNEGYQGEVCFPVVRAASRLTDEHLVEVHEWPHLIVNCASSDVSERLSRLFAKSHIRVSTCKVGIQHELWRKYAFVTSISVATTIHPGPCSDALTKLETQRTFRALCDEFDAWGVQLGHVNCRGDFIEEAFRLLKSQPLGYVASMACDALAGRVGELLPCLEHAKHGNPDSTAFGSDCRLLM